MSRTHRRKNAECKQYRIEEHYRNRSYDPVKANARFHSDAWLDVPFIHRRYPLGGTKRFRQIAQQELREALQRGEEDALLPISKKADTNWVFAWLYYW